MYKQFWLIWTWGKMVWGKEIGYGRRILRGWMDVNVLAEWRALFLVKTFGFSVPNSVGLVVLLVKIELYFCLLCWERIALFSLTWRSSTSMEPDGWWWCWQPPHKRRAPGCCFCFSGWNNGGKFWSETIILISIHRTPFKVNYTLCSLVRQMLPLPTLGGGDFLAT